MITFAGTGGAPLKDQTARNKVRVEQGSGIE